MTSRYEEQRAKRTPPHAPLRALRVVSGLTLADVASRASTFLQEMDIPEGPRGRSLTEAALSAIELGHRGPSIDTLRALEHAYGLDENTLTTSHTPRRRSVAKAAS